MHAPPQSGASALDVLLRGIEHNAPFEASRLLVEQAASIDHASIKLGLASIAALHALRPKRTRKLAHRSWALARQTPSGSADRMVAAAALSFAAAWGPDSPFDGALEQEFDNDWQQVLAAEQSIAALAKPGSPLEHFLRYQLAESRLACGRVAEAAALVDAGAGLVPPDPGGPQANSAAVAHVLGALMRARTLLFAGRVAAAEEEIGRIAAPVPEQLEPAVAATHMLIAGNADDRATAQQLMERLRDETGIARSYRSAGLQVLVAYGYLGTGDLVQAAYRVHLSRSCGPLLEIDDALSLETLVALASAEGDLEAAEAWLQSIETTAAGKPARPTLLRTQARVQLLRGDPHSSETLAQEAASVALAEGRLVEAAEAEIVAARARIAAHRPADAATGLGLLLELSEASGHLAARRAAAQEMRAAGRRLSPTPGSAWSGLSEREREVAMLIAAGLSNTEIATTLYLSPHTVRTHVSRVLTAFSAASRLVVATRIGALLPGPSDPPPILTTRQREVAERVERGLGNAQIANELGISMKTVEKHLTEIHRRWGVRTRTGVARLVRAAAPESL